MAVQTSTRTGVSSAFAFALIGRCAYQGGAFSPPSPERTIIRDLALLALRDTSKAQITTRFSPARAKWVLRFKARAVLSQHQLEVLVRLFAEQYAADLQAELGAEQARTTTQGEAQSVEAVLLEAARAITASTPEQAAPRLQVVPPPPPASTPRQVFVRGHYRTVR